MAFRFIYRSHWYVVIVCNPGMVMSSTRTKNFDEKRKVQQKLEPLGANPFIMVLDSLGETHSSAVSKIRLVRLVLGCRIKLYICGGQRWWRVRLQRLQ